MRGAYYNENDPFAAEWLRILILFGHIAPGDVDERSIEDVSPDDLRGYTQCHFFAGIGVWSYALRQTGWPDDRPVWTGSCPCQPFSAAGKGGGFADERHLWPAFNHLIDVCRPERVYGEQVASKDGLAWLDLVQTDLEAQGYAFGAADLCAAGVGDPHIRQRSWWVAHHHHNQRFASGAGARLYHAEHHAEPRGTEGGLADADDAERRTDAARGHVADGSDARGQEGSGDAEGHRGLGGVEHSHHHQSAAVAGDLGEVRSLQETQRESELRAALLGGGGGPGGVADDDDKRPHRSTKGGEQTGRREPAHSSSVGRVADDDAGLERRDAREMGLERQAAERSGEARRVGVPLQGFAISDGGAGAWVLCNDPDAPKWRPVEPGTFPLAYGSAARVGRLRGYGNAVNAKVAKIFIEETEAALTALRL